MPQCITFFVISLYLCTQHLFTEVEMNDRGYLSTTRNEMIIMIDSKQFLPFPLESYQDKSQLMYNNILTSSYLVSWSGA